jgi:hypothetical protein
MNPPWPGGWRYALGATGGYLLFLIALIALVIGRNAGWPPWRLGVIALVPPLIVAGQFYGAYRRVAAEDEFVRALFAKRMLASAAITIIAETAWSGAELAGAPHVPGWLLYPMIWGVFGLLTPMIKGSAP